TASASPAAVTTRSASVGLASGTGAAKAGGGRGQAPSTSAPGVPGPRAAGAADSAGAGNAGAPKRSSGWPQVPPPDLPPRPVPRAPITDVVPRRTLAAIAVAVVLVVLGTVLVLTWGNDDSSDNSKGADTKAAASRGAASGSDAGSKGADDDKDGSDGSDKEADKGQDKGSDPSPDGETTDEAEGPGGSSPSPTGGADGSVSGDGSGSGTLKTETYKSGQGFSIGLPDGWKYRSTDAAGARFSGPEGQRLLVGWTTTPKSDPVADWKNQERYMVRSQYKRIRIEAVDYRGWNAADWEFTYVESGTKYRSIDRGFVVDSRQGYALMYTAKASKWSGELRKDTWRTFTKTFKPKS
ncbi:serine/threonine protein kinase, partial [Streptomyces scabiei]|nr:serine/threonine protein kinase [Streptomyces scabiei]